VVSAIEYLADYGHSPEYVAIVAPVMARIVHSYTLHNHSLIFRPSTSTRSGEVDVLWNDYPIPCGWQLVTAEPVPTTGSDRDRLAWVHRLTVVLPILRVETLPTVGGA
jgi:hypothetical protein